MKTVILGLGHKARHGKDSVAAAISDTLPGTRIFSFADELKAIARALGMTTKNAPFLQKLGEALRTLDQDFFVKRMLLRIEESSPRFAVIPDVRYPNEVRAIQDREGLVVKVSRLDEYGAPWVAKDRDPNHESETALDGFPFDDAFVIADGDLAGIKAAAASLAATLTWKAEGRRAV